MGTPRKPRLSRGELVALALVVLAILYGAYRWQLYVLVHDGTIWAEDHLLVILRDERLQEIRAAQRAATSRAERAKVGTRLPGKVEVLGIEPVSRSEFILAGRHSSFGVRVVARTDLDPEPREFVLRYRRALGTVFSDRR